MRISSFPVILFLLGVLCQYCSNLLTLFLSYWTHHIVANATCYKSFQVDTWKMKWNSILFISHVFPFRRLVSSCLSVNVWMLLSCCKFICRPAFRSLSLPPCSSPKATFGLAACQLARELWMFRHHPCAWHATRCDHRPCYARQWASWVRCHVQCRFSSS